MQTALEKLLSQIRQIAKSEREKGTYFENIIIDYFNNKPCYQTLYSNIQK